VRSERCEAPARNGQQNLALGWVQKAICPHQALRFRRSAFVLVLERCCLQKRRVNPTRSAFPELHPRSGLKGAHKAHRNRARPRARKWGWVGEVWKYCAKSELHPRSGLAVLKGHKTKICG
jgi:hypothetical protein